MSLVCSLYPSQPETAAGWANRKTLPQPPSTWLPTSLHSLPASCSRSMVVGRRSKSGIRCSDRPKRTPNTQHRTPITEHRTPKGALMVQRDDLIRYIDDYLRVREIRDYGPQGLQVEGRSEVRKVVTAVSASLELFRRAA